MPIVIFSASKTIHLLHLLSFLSLVMSQSPENMPFHCSHLPNNTASAKFTSNLQRLFQTLSEVAGKDAYNKTTEGRYPDKVYGLYLCRGDVNNESCGECVDLATDTIQKDCDGTKEAVIWSDKCMVRYSDRSLSPNSETWPSNCSTHRENSTEPETLRKTVAKSLKEVIAMATLNNESKYATHVVNFSSKHKLYSLVQCIPELSTEDCRACLTSAATSILRCYQDKKGARFLNPSCNIRFELYPFFTSNPPPAAGPNAWIPPSGRNANRKWIEIGGSVSGSILIVMLFVSFLWRTRQRNKKEQEERAISREAQLLELGEIQIGSHYSYILREEKQVESKEFPLFPFDLTVEATQHFSDENKLGEGGFGPVYKGVLADGQEIAVKRLSRTSGQGLEEFMNEVTVIAKLQHKNLVRLLGCCLRGNELLLIYEYMPNKSLDFLLFDSTRNGQLDWERRVGIINGIARGLLYLHEDSRLKIIHRDLKASNILLDHDMNPKISDFGMARIFRGNQNEANTNRVVGTYGYMAPEYAMEGLFSVKSDVFSFGVLLLEIISGKKNSSFYLSDESRSLLAHAWKLWCEGNALELMDPVLKQSFNPDEVLKCIHIGLLCVQADPEDRLTMSSVVVMLASDTVTLPKPTQPPFSFSRVALKLTQCSSNIRDCFDADLTLSNGSPR
ncbi:putative receptor-like protein kinase At4g00960 [Citrus clementina]|nr:putative receptor-like protein kinase At4g00960 [Citrus x clementina]